MACVLIHFIFPPAFYFTSAFVFISRLSVPSFKPASAGTSGSGSPLPQFCVCLLFMCFYLFASLCNFKECSLDGEKAERRRPKAWEMAGRLAGWLAGCWMVALLSTGLFPCQDEARVLCCLILQSGHNKYLTLHKSLKSCQKQGLLPLKCLFRIHRGWP